jgi:hypothetical protein
VVAIVLEFPVLSDEQIRERDGNRCVVCGLVCSVLDVHHRKLRAQGGDDRASNRVTVGRVHHDWAHANRDEARRLGLIVPRRGDPARVPLEKHPLWPGQPVVLLDDGGIKLWLGEDDDDDDDGGRVAC